MRQNNEIKKRRPLSIHIKHQIQEGLFLLGVAFALFLLIALLTYQASDPGWSSTGLHTTVANKGGKAGAWLADVFLSLFGAVAYFFPFCIVAGSWGQVKDPEEISSHSRLGKSLGWLCLVLSSCGLISLYFHFQALPANAGGIIGDILSRGLTRFLNLLGSSLLLMTLFLSSITLVSGLSWLGVIDMIGEKIYNAWLAWRERRANLKKIAKPSSTLQKFKTDLKIIREEPVLSERIFPLLTKKSKVQNKVLSLLNPDKKKDNKRIETVKLLPGTLPPLSLLTPPVANNQKQISNVNFEELSRLVEQRLADFSVEARVVAVHPGPVITRFELELAPGVKVSKITGLVKDIARSLSAVSVRVVEVIPGKSVIGLEIPNENRELVTLREILESQRYNQIRSPVALALGKDTSGEPIVVDLVKMPHLLVAGTTGSGKSVSLNVMLLSMLFKATPDQLRLILIDPKMLELSVYDGIPHLLTPVITDMKDAANALRWCVSEMDKRYKLMAALGVRNIAGYNQKVNEAISQNQPLTIPGILADTNNAATQLMPLPTVVVVADELADLMMVVGKKIEDLITRIAQKARAAGIHLILATQRPSVDVITGLIKANIPTRIAFQVSSRIDSRTILDQQGAEQLLGHGDMLYLPPGAGIPMRVHGAYVIDEEVHRVVAAWRSYGEPSYLTDVTAEMSENNNAENQGGGEEDPLYDQALRIVTESRRASISLVQRRLRIGYNRAARMLEEMELAGVVSTMDTSGSREVLAPPPVSID